MFKLKPSYRSNQAIRGYCVVLWLAALSLLSLNSCTGGQPPQQPPLNTPAGAGVNGSVYLRLPQAAAGRAKSLPRFVHLSDFAVYLKNVETGVESAPQSTDASGHYMFPRLKPGTYELRWREQAGWAEGAHPERVVIGDKTQYPKPISPAPRAGTGVLVGSVKLADGSSPWFYEEFFGINHTAQVEALDKNGGALARPVKVNAVGEFAVAGLPNADLLVRATSEASKVEQAVPASAIFKGGPVTPVSLTLNNRRPRIQSVVAKVGQRLVSNANPGEAVVVTASVQDADQDGLKIICRSPVGAGEVTPTNAPANWNWSLPQPVGRRTVYVLASDGKGGYATASLSLSVGAPAESSGASPAPPTLAPSPAPGPSPVPSPGVPYLTRKGIGSQSKAENYYAAIDPNRERETLGEWWSKNGFDQEGNAAGEVRTSYQNANDLGFGRDMHVLRHADGTVSAYVTNYGNASLEATGNADLAAARRPEDRAATVCMEHSPVEGQDAGTRIVKFFVYGGGVAASVRIPSANLDGGGEKFVPNLCLNCHGGNYNLADTATPSLQDVDMKSSFREFDLATFRYPEGRAAPNDDERTRFKQQNLMVKGSDSLTSNPDGSFLISQPAIKELIRGWYADGSNNQDINFAPPGWAAPQTKPLYLDVVATSCRTCHIALDTDNRGISWSTFDEFLSKRDEIAFLICDFKEMPHAKITFENFWRSTRPNAFANFSATGWEPVGQCLP